MAKHLEIQGNNMVVVHSTFKEDTRKFTRARGGTITIEDARKLSGFSFASVTIYASAKIEEDARNFLLSLCTDRFPS